MRFVGTHRTSYRYSEPVFLEPHTFRLCPRSDPRQTVHAFDIDITPQPDGISRGIDVFGNWVAWTWSSGKTATLDITTRFEVTTERENPYDFIVPTTEAAQIPPGYAREVAGSLGPYLLTDASEAVHAYTAEIVGQADGDLLDFLRLLTERINRDVRVVIRELGDPFPSAQTLTEAVGSCRDVSMLFVDACRCAGIASRFVSGYQAGDPDTQRRDLHAWGAAYIPGGGWRGFDPTLGLAVTDGHVTLAAAPSPPGAAPATGTFRGEAELTEFSFHIDLDVT